MGIIFLSVQPTMTHGQILGCGPGFEDHCTASDSETSLLFLLWPGRQVVGVR